MEIMRSIGFRVQPKVVTFAIYDSESAEIINIETIGVPEALYVPERLKYIRNNVLDILKEYKIKRAGIKITEPNAQTINLLRVQIEGVIQEAFASSELEKYVAAHISTLSSLLEIQRIDFKKYIDNELTYTQVENWGTLKPIEREAVLSAIGAINA